MKLGRRTVLLSISAGSAMALAGCKIVPLGQEGAAAPGGFDAAGYVSSLWTQKALPHITATAKPLPDVLTAIAADLPKAGAQFGYRAAAEGSPWTFLVSGTGTVTKKNTTSRAGSLTVTADGATPPAEISIQIGPVVRGSAIRDSLPFVSFKDFTNQLEYAEVGKALTAKALEGVAQEAEAVAEGQKVSFTGAMSVNSKADKIVITPIALKAES